MDRVGGIEAHDSEIECRFPSAVGYFKRRIGSKLMRNRGRSDHDGSKSVARVCVLKV